MNFRWNRQIIETTDEKIAIRFIGTNYTSVHNETGLTGTINLTVNIHIFNAGPLFTRILWSKMLKNVPSFYGGLGETLNNLGRHYSKHFEIILYRDHGKVQIF